MAKKDYFFKRVHDIINELRVPLLDQRVYNKIEIVESRALLVIQFTYDEEDQVIQGFLTLAEFFKSVIFAQKDAFYIVNEQILFKLVCK